MLVQELIENLKSFNPLAEVHIPCSSEIVLGYIADEELQFLDGAKVEEDKKKTKIVFIEGVEPCD